MMKDHLPIHGYDDAISGRVRLFDASRSWRELIAQDLRSARDVTHLGRMLGLRGMEQAGTYIFDQKDIEDGLALGDPDAQVKAKFDTGMSIDAMARKMYKIDRQVLRDAPLVYITPGVIDRIDEFPTTIPDVHVLPFTEPMILWFSRPVEGDPFVSATAQRKTQLPVRAALVRPDEQAGKVFFHSFFHTDELHATIERLGGAHLTPEQMRAQYGEYSGDTVGVVTCGNDAAQIGLAAGNIARALNAMSARDVRMAEDETPSKIVRKESKRAQIKDPGAIHVIYLPRERKQGSKYVPSDQNPDGTKRRRHKVRSHWRRQPYGPKGAGQWRWKRIEAHERGVGAYVEPDTIYATRG